MPLSTTATYTQFGTVNVAGLSIDNPASYAGQTLQLGLGFQATGRGRYTTERISAPNIRGGNAGIWYEELNFWQATGSAEEINSLLGTLRYHSDANGFSMDHIGTVTLAVWNGATIGSGTIQFTHQPLYDNPPLNWTEAIGVARQYAAYTPNSNQTFNLPSVGPNDSTMLRMTVEARSTVPFYEVTGSIGPDGQPSTTIPANTVFSVNGTIVGTYSNFTSMQTGLVAATAPGQPLFRYRVQPRRRNRDSAIVGLRLHYFDRLQANEIGVPSSASFSHGIMLGLRAEIVRDVGASHPYGAVVRMIEESNRSTEWDGVLNFYSHRQAVNSALFRTRWQPRSYTGVARFQVRVGDGKGSNVINDLYRYSDLGTLLNRNQSRVLFEETSEDLNGVSPWWVVAPDFNTDFARYTSVLRPSDRFACVITPKRSPDVDYGEATAVWTQALPPTAGNQVGQIVISNGTRGRRGGYRWGVGDTASVAGGSGTAAVIRVDQIIGPWQIPFQTMTSFITASGSGYAVGDFVRLNGGSFNYPHRMRVLNVNGTGGVTGLAEDGAGGGEYTQLPPLGTPLTTARQTGNGTGLTITLPTNMRLTGAASAISLTNQGAYTTNPPTLDNEVLLQGSSTGFWLQVNLNIGQVDLGGYLTINGQRDEVNNILGDLNVTLAQNYLSAFSVVNTVTSTLGLNTSGTMACSVTNVNDATLLTNGSATHIWREDVPYSFSPPMVVADIDPAPLTLTMTLPTAAGAISSSFGGSFNSATGVWSVTGGVSLVNTVLSSIRYLPTSNYDANFSISVIAGGTAGTLTMTCIQNVDASVLSGPFGYRYNPQTKHMLVSPPLVLTDPDSDDVLTMTLTPSNAGAGMLGSDAAGWTRLGSNGVRIVGSVQTVNSVLSQLHWTAAVSGTLSLTLASPTATFVEDTPYTMRGSLSTPFVSIAGSGFDTSSLNIAVASTDNSGANVQRNVQLAPENFVARQVTVVVTMPSNAGSIDLPAVSRTARTSESVSGGIRSYAVTGVDVDVNAVIREAVFRPALNYDQSFTITINSGPLTRTFSMVCQHVNDIHTVTGLNAAYSGVDTDQNIPLIGVRIEDPDTVNDEFSARISMSNPAAGMLWSPAASSNDSGVWSLTASRAVLNSQLSLIEYRAARTVMDVLNTNSNNRIPLTFPRLEVRDTASFRSPINIRATFTDSAANSVSGTIQIVPAQRAPGIFSVVFDTTKNIRPFFPASAPISFSGMNSVALTGDAAAINAAMASATFRARDAGTLVGRLPFQVSRPDGAVIQGNYRFFAINRGAPHFPGAGTALPREDFLSSEAPFLRTRLRNRLPGVNSVPCVMLAENPQPGPEYLNLHITISRWGVFVNSDGSSSGFGRWYVDDAESISVGDILPLGVTVSSLVTNPMITTDNRSIRSFVINATDRVAMNNALLGLEVVVEWKFGRHRVDGPIVPDATSTVSLDGRLLVQYRFRAVGAGANVAPEPPFTTQSYVSSFEFEQLNIW